MCETLRLKRIFLFIALFTYMTEALCSQSYSEMRIPLSELLQYQRTKSKLKDKNAPFGKYGFRHIRANRVLENSHDSVRLWGFNVSANLEYDKAKQPLYRLFKRNNIGSMAVIDYIDGKNDICQLVFWDKRYYRLFYFDLCKMGFSMNNSLNESNRLEFRRKDTTIGVDIVIWGDIYILEVIRLSGLYG